MGAHTGTCFSVEGLNTVVAFLTGALAGKPLADLVFCTAMGRCLTLFHTELLEAGILYCDDRHLDGADHF